MTKEPHFIEPAQYRDKRHRGEKILMVDVRSPEEFRTAHIEGAINIPESELAARVKELPKDATVVTVCNKGGVRSCGAAEKLHDLGYKAFPLRGGVHGWRNDGSGE